MKNKTSEIHKVLEKYQKFVDAYENADHYDDLDTTTVSYNKNDINDTSSKYKYKIYPNIYNWFNRNERRILTKRCNINLDIYL